jgi:phosphoglycerate dehydrogenase-like enzyme
MKILVPSIVELDYAAGDGEVLQSYDPSAALDPDQLDADVLVVWGNSAPQLADAARRLGRLKWVQSLSSGMEAVHAAQFPPHVVLTSGKTLHDATVAEHALAMTLALVRSLPTLVLAQVRHEWCDDIGGMQDEGPDEPLRTLSGSKVLIWGFGSIARRLAPLLSSLGAVVTGVARTEGVRQGYRVIDQSNVSQELPGCDVLILILPDTEANHHVLDAELIRLLPSRSIVINVGRGSSVSESALLAAVHSGEIAGAALDVFQIEPLPKESPLWDEGRILITPHSAGGRPRGAAALFRENLARFRTGRPMLNLSSPTDYSLK